MTNVTAIAVAPSCRVMRDDVAALFATSPDAVAAVFGAECRWDKVLARCAACVGADPLVAYAFFPATVADNLAAAFQAKYGSP